MCATLPLVASVTRRRGNWKPACEQGNHPIDSLTNCATLDAAVIESVLSECIRRYATPDARMFPVFDRERGHFLVIEEGLLQNKHLYNPFVHVELQNGAVWVQQDYTNHGIANNLVAAGISQDRIVLGYKAPGLRPETEFALR